MSRVTSAVAKVVGALSAKDSSSWAKLFDLKPGAVHKVERVGEAGRDESWALEMYIPADKLSDWGVSLTKPAGGGKRGKHVDIDITNRLKLSKHLNMGVTNIMFQMWAMEGGTVLVKAYITDSELQSLSDKKHLKIN